MVCVQQDKDCFAFFALRFGRPLDSRAIQGKAGFVE